MLTIEQSRLIQNWQEAKVAAAQAVIRERELRTQVVAALFPDATLGTNNLDIGNNWKLKFVKSINYKLDTKDLDATTGEHNTDRALNIIRSTGNDGPFIADRLVKWKPELSVAEYKMLSDTHKKIIDKGVTTSDALPEIELVSPPMVK